MKRKYSTYVFVIGFLLCCLGCQTKAIRPGLYVVEDNPRGLAFREDGTGWLVHLDYPESGISLRPFFWFQTGNDLEIFIESPPHAFPCPFVGRVRKVTAESFQFLEFVNENLQFLDLDNLVWIKAPSTWVRWMRTSPPQFEAWYPGMLHTECASRTNLSAIVDSLADGTMIHLAERLHAVGGETGREKQLLQIMIIWVYKEGVSLVCYKNMAFDRGDRYKSGFTEMVPVFLENQRLTVPTESIGTILSQHVFFDDSGKTPRISQPWRASMTFLQDQDRGVKIQNWPVSHVPLSMIWNSFLIETNRLAKIGKCD